MRRYIDERTQMTSPQNNDDSQLARLSTGIGGLDDILCGGLIPRRLYLLEGNPGSGKTTMALQFLLEGVRQGERCLCVTLSENEEELQATAQSHGWSLDGLEMMEIMAADETLHPDKMYTMYHPSEVELGETTRAVIKAAEKINPTRMVIDSLSEFRLLSGNQLRYRRQVLAMKQHFVRQGCTVIFVDDLTGDPSDKHLHSIAHGVIRLDRETVAYGNTRRRIEVTKLRSQAFREGRHDITIRKGGIVVFPRLVAAEHASSRSREPVTSGIEQLDHLLGGGLAQGTSTLITGPAGTGKSSLASQFANAAVLRGDHAALFLFDEAVETFIERSDGLGIDVQRLLDKRQISIRQVDPTELTPGEFSHLLRETVEKRHTKLVVIDSVNGYFNAMPSERLLMLHLHELLTYLGQQGVTTLLMMTQQGIIGEIDARLDVSYIADTVILLRYFEAFGEVRQAISVIKKRTGKHERTVREMRLDGGVHLGEPLRDFRGILTGFAEFIGGSLPSTGRASEHTSDP